MAFAKLHAGPGSLAPLDSTRMPAASANALAMHRKFQRSDFGPARLAGRHIRGEHIGDFHALATVGTTAFGYYPAIAGPAGFNLEVVRLLPSRCTALT